MGVGVGVGLGVGVYGIRANPSPNLRMPSSPQSLSERSSLFKRSSGPRVRVRG